MLMMPVNNYQNNLILEDNMHKEQQKLFTTVGVKPSSSIAALTRAFKQTYSIKGE